MQGPNFCVESYFNWAYYFREGGHTAADEGEAAEGVRHPQKEYRQDRRRTSGSASQVRALLRRSLLSTCKAMVEENWRLGLQVQEGRAGDGRGQRGGV